MKSITGIAGTLLFAALLVLVPTFADARGSSSGHSHSSSHSSSHHSTHSGSRAKAIGVPRNTHGKIARSATARHQFQHSHPCPSTGKSSGACSGYVIDHVTALKRGGSDSPGNMQWQTKEAAKIKDRTE